jgi:hypothetical protein
MSTVPLPETTMKRSMKALILAAIIALPMLSTGCVYVPGRAYHGSEWVPGHWAGAYRDAWVPGHWR